MSQLPLHVPEQVAGQYDLHLGQVSEREQLSSDEFTGQLRQRGTKHEHIRTDLAAEPETGDAI